MVSYPQILLLDLPEKSPFFRPLQQIQQSGERAAAIVHDLLTMARRAVETMTPVTLAAVIDDYFQSPEFIKLQANHPGVHLSYHNQSPEIRILGARHQLSKVVMNLVSNAAEATAPSGDVKVSLTLCHLPEAHSGYEDVPPGHYAVIDVTDTGTGINVNDMGRIFEPFYTKKNMGHSGTGLGLAVVWGIVKDHGGFIDIRTQNDRGTIFSLYFPKTDQANGSGEQMMKLEDYMGQGESILVVDDVVEQRQIAEIMLKRLGYTVTTVKSGEKALQLTDKKPFDVLLLDMIMEPGIDGLETYKHQLDTRQYFSSDNPSLNDPAPYTPKSINISVSCAWLNGYRCWMLKRGPSTVIECETVDPCSFASRKNLKNCLTPGFSVYTLYMLCICIF